MEKALFYLRLLLEQSVEDCNSYGIIVCVSFFVVNNVYRTFITSNLLVPMRVQPVENISNLFQNDYNLIYTELIGEASEEIKKYPGLKIENLVIANQTLKEFSVSALQMLYGKVVKMTVHLN